MNFSMGFWATVPMIGEAEADVLAAFVESPVWGLKLKHFTPMKRPKTPWLRRPGVLRDHERHLIRAAFVHPDSTIVYIDSAEKSTHEWAGLSVEIERTAWRPILTMDGRRWLPNKRSERHGWVDEVTGVFDRLRVDNAIIVVQTDDAVMSETTLGGIVVNDVVQHPFPDQLERMALAREKLGGQYIRFPRWGTLLSPGHLERLGGAARVVEVVQPAIVRALSGGTYFQLTERVADALSETAMEKQARFVELAAPLLPPPR